MLPFLYLAQTMLSAADRAMVKRMLHLIIACCLYHDSGRFHASPSTLIPFGPSIARSRIARPSFAGIFRPFSRPFPYCSQHSFECASLTPSTPVSPTIDPKSGCGFPGTNSTFTYRRCSGSFWQQTAGECPESIGVCRTCLWAKCTFRGRSGEA